MWQPPSMSLLSAEDDDPLGTRNQRDTTIQLALSIALGLSSFIAFCILRPQWPGLYAARKKQRDAAEPLPELPNTAFGWIPALLRITEQQVLASAGLDAYVFLRLFRMATKWLLIALFFSLVVFKPVHDAFPSDTDDTPSKNGTKPHDPTRETRSLHLLKNGTEPHKPSDNYPSFANDYLWMYLIFAYVFTGLALYLLITETEKIIGVRQEYLGSQSTTTDRTIRLSGIPPSLRSEEKLKEFIETLQIGKVESVTICRKWEELDRLLDKRHGILRKLEESFTVYLSQRHRERKHRIFPFRRSIGTETTEELPNDDEETGRLLDAEERDPSDIYSQARPKATIRYGWFRMHSKYVDAIDYYEMLLQTTDQKIEELRKSKFEPTPIAFVTLDSVAACQMAVQAVLDPSPMQLIASLSPAPADIIWRNTYLPRKNRMLRGWAITAVIVFLTIFWGAVLLPIVGALNIETIRKLLPRLAEALEAHPFLSSLVRTQLPTLASTLLFVAVPYLYDWLANLQGMTSRGEVEMSVIAKNFFFVFFNYFVVLTILGTFANFYSMWQKFQDSLKDFTSIAYTLANSLQRLQPFYTNLVILQGLGLFPLRLLEVGSVLLYPIYRLGAKTPRDYAELVQPPVFNYGFYLPQVMLVFLICIVYSILRESWKILLAGLIYFVLGGMVYKYQLLYAMDHRQHSTGRAWVMICNRMMIGLVIFQISTAGQLALQQAYARAAATVPLILATIAFSYYYSKNYSPLMKFISLRSIERRAPPPDPSEVDPDGWGEQAVATHGHAGQDRDSGYKFVNPSLVQPLEDVWIADEAAREVGRDDNRDRMASALNAAI